MNTKLPIWHTAWFSWWHGWRVTGAMPKLAMIAFVLILADFTLDELIAPDELERPVAWQQLLGLAAAVPFAFFTTPLLIAFYRYLLLGEISHRYALDFFSSRFRAFFGYSVVVGLITEASIYLAEMAGPLGYVSGIGLVVVVVLFTAMLFPAIAVGAPGANVMNAVRDLRPLRALAIGIAALLTWVFFPIVLLSVLLGKVEFPTPGAEQAAQVVILSVFGFVLEVIGLVLSAQFYRAWARRLGRPAGIIE